MSDTFQIDTPGVDVKKVVEEIRARVDQKRAEGVYQRYNLSSLRAVEVDSNANDDAHCDFYLRNIWAAANARVTRHIGLGAGWRYTNYHITVTKNDWEGYVRYKYSGPALFLTLAF